MRSSSVGYEDVGQAHELHELEQLAGRVAELDAAVATPRSELQARERVDCRCIRTDSCDVTSDDLAASGEDGARALAETRQIRTRDRAADGEGDLVRLRCGHRSLDRPDGRN
jgi:hypothetical protein